VLGEEAETPGFVVETMGLEPTTPCLQSRIVSAGHLHPNCKGAGQTAFRVTGIDRCNPSLPVAMGTQWARSLAFIKETRSCK
jgi:hypothetical protein